MKLAELEARARATLAGKSRSYVDDARAFAQFFLDHKHVLENLTATQDRCNDLLKENRALRGIPQD